LKFDTEENKMYAFYIEYLIVWCFCQYCCWLCIWWSQPKLWM